MTEFTMPGERLIVVRLRSDLRWEFLGEDLLPTAVCRSAAVFTDPFQALQAVRAAFGSSPDSLCRMDRFELREMDQGTWPAKMRLGALLLNGPTKAVGRMGKERR